MSGQTVTVTKKIVGVDETKLIHMKHKLIIGGTQFESVFTEPVHSNGRLPERFYSKRVNPCSPDIHSNQVSDIRNSVKNAPYKLKVTGKWTVRNKIRGFPNSSFVFWFYLFVMMLIIIICITEILKSKQQPRDLEIRTLQTLITQLEKRTRDLENYLVTLHLHYDSSKINVQTLPSDSVDGAVKRWKRADTEAVSDSKNRKRNQQNQPRSKETVAIQFSGSMPYGFTMVPPEGILGPWIESTNDLCSIEKFGARLSDRHSKVEINKDGVYMVYAQVTYQSINVSNSYSIMAIANTDKSRFQSIATCSSFGKIVQDGEISCYTSVVKRLNAGDVVYVQQSQPNREIIFSRSYTFFGFVFLMT